MNRQSELLRLAEELERLGAGCPALAGLDPTLRRGPRWRVHTGNEVNRSDGSTWRWPLLCLMYQP